MSDTNEPEERPETDGVVIEPSPEKPGDRQYPKYRRPQKKGITRKIPPRPDNNSDPPNNQDTKEGGKRKSKKARKGKKSKKARKSKKSKKSRKSRKR